jgi:hypothetical protein
MNTMDDDYISQHDIVRQYLKGKLTPEETVEFEEYILDKPELLELLEMDSVMVEHLPKEFSSPPKIEQNKKSGWTPLFSNITAIAACSLLAVTLWLGQPTSEINPNFSPNIVYLENYRSANSVTTLTFKQGESFKIIAIDVPPDSGNEFDLRILSKNGQYILVQHLQTNGNNEVTFLLYSTVLMNEKYRLELTKDERVISSFALNVINQGKE